MLRGLEKGYAGHARLEKRVTSGTLDFTVSTPNQGEALSAALIGPWAGRLVVKPLGAFRDDDRGQKGLLASFDPRNIEGLELGDMSAAVVLREEADGATPVMYGWINGSKPLDWTQTANEVASFFAKPAAKTSALPPPEQTETDLSAQAGIAEGAAERQDEEIPVSAANEPGQEIEEPPVSAAETAEKRDAEIPDSAANAPERENEEPPVSNAGTTEQKNAESAAEKPLPAGSALNLDMRKRWPEDVEDLRALFMTLPRYEPFDMEGFVFVRAGMASETGIDHCAVGIRAEDGRVTGVSYAIPMAYSAEPPAGLEDAVWIGDSNRGWWVTVQNLAEET